MADLNITITDAARSSVTIASPGPQGPAGAALSPVADETLLGNASGGIATPTALTTSQVKELLGYLVLADLQAAIVAGDGIIINSVPGSGTDPFSTLLVAGDGIAVEYSSINRQWTIEATGGGGGGGANLSVSTTSTTVVVASDSGSDATLTAATALAAGVMTAAMFVTLQSALQEEFETVAKNLKSYPSALSYTGDRLDSIVYTLPSGTITKTLGYTGDKLTSVVLSGSTPSGIELTKTLSYTGDNLTGVAYS